MSQATNHSPQIRQLVETIVASYHADARTNHLDSTFLPNRGRTIQIIELLRRVMFPGFFDDTRLSSATIAYHVGELITQARDLLYEQIREALRYEANRMSHDRKGDRSEHFDGEADKLTLEFLQRIPDLRRLLALDAQAGFDGDPAASCIDEVIFCYPGLDAIFTHRVAHELHKLKVPLLPRIMSEAAHADTGIDLHPGASIGESFFIDHGTGVVIGETSVIGNRVKVYQGVTLGALSTKGGQSWRGVKRHPTIEDDVTIYGGAIILGGETVIGKGATIGGSVFLTSSVPAGSTITMKPPELKVSNKADRKRAKTSLSEVPLDFQI
ncbi:MAG: hypothetical protein WD042_04980 [Phycisphaeraceae bacterium]